MSNVSQRVFTAMSNAYGRQFSGQFSSEAQIASWHELWGAELDRFSDAAVQHGIREAMMAGAAFVPSLPEFMRACQAYHPPGYKPPQHNERGPISAATAAALRDSLEKLAKRERGAWWTPAKVVNEAQVYLIVRQADHFGRMSIAGRFLDDCIEAGVITADGQLGRGKAKAATAIDEAFAPWDDDE